MALKAKSFLQICCLNSFLLFTKVSICKLVHGRYVLIMNDIDKEHLMSYLNVQMWKAQNIEKITCICTKEKEKKDSISSFLYVET